MNMQIPGISRHLKKSILIVVLICSSCIYGVAQQKGPSIYFNKTSYDYGNIKESDGPVAFTFEFINSGNAALIVKDVQVSCGCTTPEWTQAPVGPGEKGLITVLFDPENRQGEFYKSLTIFSNGNAQPIKLYVLGNVEPMARSIEDQYPIVMGGIRVKYSIISFETITNEKPVTKTITVYNDMNKEVSFDREIEAPDHIKVKFLPQPIPPKSIGTFQVTYDPREIELLGYKSDFLEIETNEWFNSTKEFRVIAALEEYFPTMTPEQLTQAPRLKIENPVHDFGKISQGASVSKEFVITNTGKEELNIRMTRASCGCTASKPEKNDLKPGESSTIKVTFNPEGKDGDQSEFILVFSNDPSNPKQKITIKSSVEN